MFVQCLEEMRHRFAMRIYGYVVMPEHVHILVSEPEQAMLADAMHFLKLSFAKRLQSRNRTCQSVPFWQKRYYDRNVRDAREFTVKLRYLHRNPVARGLVNAPADWKWSSFRHYALREMGTVEIESKWTAVDRETKTRGGSPRVFPGKDASRQLSPPFLVSKRRGVKNGASLAPPHHPMFRFRNRRRSG